MNNLEKYNKVFCESFSLEEGFNGDDIMMNETADWDSVGHITLINTLEDTFEIMFETNDILTLNSYNQGIEILKKYGIEI